MQRIRLQKQEYSCAVDTYVRVVDGVEYEVVMPRFEGPVVDLGYDFNNPDFWAAHLERDNGGAAQIAAGKAYFRNEGYDLSGKSVHHLPSNPGECILQLVDTAQHQQHPHYGGMSINNDQWLRNKLKTQTNY